MCYLNFSLNNLGNRVFCLFFPLFLYLQKSNLSFSSCLKNLKLLAFKITNFTLEIYKIVSIKLIFYKYLFFQNEYPYIKTHTRILCDFFCLDSFAVFFILEAAPLASRHFIKYFFSFFSNKVLIFILKLYLWKIKHCNKALFPNNLKYLS